MEPATVPVELPQVRLVIHVQPFTTCSAGLCCSRGNDRNSETLPLIGRMHHGVQEEAVYAAIPDHMNERNEVTLKECAHPRNTVAAKSFAPRRNRTCRRAKGQRM